MSKTRRLRNTGSGRRLSKARALRVLKDVAEALNSAPTEQAAVGEALGRMADLLGVATGWVWLRDPASDHFYNAAVRSLPPYLLEPVRMTGDSCWCLELFRTGRLTAQNIDVVECSRLAPAVAARQMSATRGLRCHASVPVYAGDRPLGVMNLAMRGWRKLTRQELDLLTTIADQVGVAVERARLGERSVEHARADERARIARDVHDTLAQAFTAIALHLEAGLARLQPGDKAQPSIRKALDAARRGVDEARESIRSLRTAPLEDRPLAEALAQLSRHFTASTGVRVRIALSDVGPLPPEVEAELFRIAGEALANIRKHAAAHEALLRLDTVKGRLRLTVADAGIGFRLHGARQRGFGLQGIEDRARLVGGRATIRSAPGRGTVVTAVVPLPATPPSPDRRTPR
ncbi:MAG TPA: GAF domain-containing sensor histidine kinase [Vicinamibacterales bacterium]|nr:GAF domain-containing sensor histidine kinase [Vicinamibacterales bacterium]